MKQMAHYDGTKVRDVLTAQGRKARWLAAQVGEHESTISRICNGKRLAERTLAERIARTLDVPLFLLFDLRESPKVGRPRKQIDQEDRAA